MASSKKAVFTQALVTLFLAIFFYQLKKKNFRILTVSIPSYPKICLHFPPMTTSTDG